MSNNQQGKVMDLIYQKVNEMLGAGNQLFCMQFPAQPLNPRQYEYDTSDSNSVLTRPYTVAEAEFRLSDQLFDVAPITQGSNGEKLSIVYNTLLNNYLPQLQHLVPFIRDRAGLGSFLLEDSGEKDSKGKPISPMELCKDLYRVYLESKSKWDEDKTKEYEKYKAKGDLDGYAKWLSTVGMVRQEEINNLYNDVVVRGHLHEVITILGYLNASSIAEELELAKQRMRHSARLAMDESMTVYPVQFSPNNWFKALSPNLNPQDLTMAQESLKDQFRAKQRELSRVHAELKEIEFLSADPAEIEKLQAEVEQGKKALSKAESELVAGYGQSIVTAAKIYLGAKGNGKTKSGSRNKNSGSTNAETTVTPDVLDSLGLELPFSIDPAEYAKSVEEVVTNLTTTYNNQQTVLQSAEKLTQLQARKTQLESQDLRLQKLRLQQRVEELQNDVEYYGQLLAGVYQQKAKLPAESTSSDAKEKPLTLPAPATDPEIDGIFTDIIIKSSKSQANQSTTSQSSASNSSWNVSGWFFSAGGNSSSSSTTGSSESEFFNEDIDIGFRVAKVSFERGGWFNPQIFKMSHAFYRLAELRAGAGLTVDKVQQSMQVSPDNTDFNKKNLKQLLSYTDNDPGDEQKEYPYILPAFPTAMAIVKDIVIRIKKQEGKSHSVKSVMEQSSTSGGGFLGFSCSSAASSKNASDASFHGEESGFYYIRIPGPQILAYFLQFVPEDKAEKYEPMSDETGKKNSVLDALRLYEVNNQLSATEQPQIAPAKVEEYKKLLVQEPVPTTNENGAALRTIKEETTLVGEVK